MPMQIADKLEYYIELPSFSEDANLDVYFQNVTTAVRHMGWTVSTGITQLSLFSFLKINMYRDLAKMLKKSAAIV
jgi:hypothetical protein